MVELLAQDAALVLTGARRIGRAGFNSSFSQSTPDSKTPNRKPTWRSDAPRLFRRAR